MVDTNVIYYKKFGKKIPVLVNEGSGFELFIEEEFYSKLIKKTPLPKNKELYSMVNGIEYAVQIMPSRGNER